MEQLICENITKNYKSKDALDSVNLTLEKGKIYGLIGRNGAGKTTLLSILSAQNPPSEGSVVLETEEGRLSVWENEKALSHICFSRELNVGKNTALSATKVKDYLRTASVYLPHWDQELADELIRKFHLDVKQKIGKLSKGMVSMVTIIVALASKADFTFLDEPVSGLDVVAREQFYRILLGEFTETGRTFVVSTHIMEEAADLFEEVIILKEGKLLLKENTEELLESCLHISGKAEEVDRATEGLEKHYEERLGRSKSVMVRLKPGQELPDAEMTVQPMNIEKVFVALCGEEALDEQEKVFVLRTALGDHGGRSSCRRSDPCSDYLAQQRRRCPEDDLVYAGSGLYDDRIFLSSDSSYFHLYVHGSVDFGLRLPEKGSYLKFPDSEIFKFSGDSGGHSNFSSSAVSDERKSGGNPAYEGYVSDERSASPLRRLRRKSDRCSL